MKDLESLCSEIESCKKMIENLAGQLNSCSKILEQKENVLSEYEAEVRAPESCTFSSYLFERIFPESVHLDEIEIIVPAEELRQILIPGKEVQIDSPEISITCLKSDFFKFTGYSIVDEDTPSLCASECADLMKFLYQNHRPMDIGLVM